MSPKFADFKELIKKFPEIGDLDFSTINEEELLKFIYKKFNKKLLPKDLNKDFLNYLDLKLSAKNKKILLNHLRYFILISKLSSKGNVGFIQGIKQINGFNKFKKESLGRIQKLKKELNSKYPEYDVLIDTKFNNLINELEDEFTAFSPTVNKADNIKVGDTKILNSFKTKKGRPNNMLFDAFLMGVNNLSEELYPDKKYEKIIKPFFTYVAKNFPDILDINDVNTTEKLRQKVKYLKPANQKKGGK